MHRLHGRGDAHDGSGIGTRMENAIPAMVRFDKCLRPYWHGILSRVHWSMHTGLQEGINNRIAYDILNDAY